MPKISAQPAIILIHGLRGNHFGVQDIAETLTEKYGYQVFAPDLPGSGTRPELKDKTLDGYAKWFCNYIKKLKLDQPPIIIGHSMGSIVTSYFIDKYPELVDRRVILLSPIFRSSFGRAISNIEYALMSGALHLLPKKPRYNLMRSKPVSFLISHFLTVDKSKQKEIDLLHYRYCLFASADSLLADCKISMQKETIIPENKEIFFCFGDRDKLGSVKRSTSRVKEAKQTYKIIKNKGHLINYECPKTVARLIAEFIGEN